MSSPNSTNPENVAAVTSTELVSGAALAFFQIVLRTCINPSLTVLALVANIVNVVVFVKMGLSDAVTQNFFILSVSDGLAALGGTVGSLATIAAATLTDHTGKSVLSAVQAEKVYWMAFYALQCPLRVSTITTVVIAIVRCCCVAMPLRFKAVLTARRQLAAIFVASAVSVGVFIYASHSLQVRSVFNPQKNKTNIVLSGANTSVLVVSQNAISVTAFITVIVCVVIIAVSLRRSASHLATFGSGSKHPSSASHTSGRPSSSTIASSEPQRSTSSAVGVSVGRDTKLQERRRDNRVVKAVVYLCVSFILSKLPFFFFFAVYLFVPTFEYERKFVNLVFAIRIFGKTVEFLNILVTIFIYYFYSTKYRVTFQAIIRPR